MKQNRCSELRPNITISCVKMQVAVRGPSLYPFILHLQAICYIPRFQTWFLAASDAIFRVRI